MISHRHSASLMPCYALSSFMMGPATVKRSYSYIRTVAPAAKELDDWIQKKTLKLKELEMEFKENNAGKQFDPDLPPEWQKQMSQIKSTVNKTVVRSGACRLPGEDELSETFWRGVGGSDYGIEVPLVRWDCSKDYAPESDAKGTQQTYCRHA